MLMKFYEALIVWILLFTLLTLCRLWYGESDLWVSWLILQISGGLCGLIYYGNRESPPEPPHYYG